MDCYIGIDLGTSGMRTVLMSGASIIASAEQSYDVDTTGGIGWSEQSPLAWVSALKSTLRELNERCKEYMEKVVGLGVAGHMHGAVCLGKDGELLRPCILWNDTRSHKEAAVLDTSRARELCGNITFPGFTAPKLQWLRNNEPDVFQRIHKILLPASYLNYWLTGALCMDYSDAAGTSWMNIHTKSWSDELLQASGNTIKQMPTLVNGTDIIGVISKKALKNLDIDSFMHLSHDIQVVGGAGDNAAAACAISQPFVSLGTSGVLLSTRTGECLPLPASAVHTFSHALPNAWYQMGVILSCTDSLNWLQRITGKSPAELTLPLDQRLTEGYEDDSAYTTTCCLWGPNDIEFFPYLSGERTPHNDAAVRGSFIGLSTSTTVDDMTEAVIEGICFALRDSLEALKLTGMCLTSLVAVGGGTASKYWLKTLATILNLPLKLPCDNTGEVATAKGAARLAMIGIGASHSIDKVVLAPDIQCTILPENDIIREKYEKKYQKYTQAYSLLSRR